MLVVLVLCLCLSAVSALDAVRPLTTVPYGGSQIQVWKSGDLYYISPLANLLNNSAAVQQNLFTGNVQLNFQIVLTSLDAKQVVYYHLRSFNSSIVQHQIQSLPLEKVRVVWKDGNHPPSSDYRVMDAWQASSDSPSVVTFHIWCQNLEKCNVLKNVLTARPDMLYALEMEYVVADRVKKRLLIVPGERLAQTELYARMVRMPYRLSQTRYLTEVDVKKLASQTAAAAVSATLPEYVDTREESGISSLLESVLKRNPVWARDFRTWSSVYWEPSYSRPDKVALYLSTVLTQDRNDSHSFLVNESRVDAGSQETAARARELGIPRKTNVLANKTVHRVPKETVFSALRAGKHNVEWDNSQGRFRVKPFVLYELNLASLVRSEELVKSYVRARQYSHVRSVKVRSSDLNQTVQLSLEHVQARVDQQLRHLAADIRTNLTEQTNIVRTKLSEQTNRVERKLNRTRNVMNETLRTLGNVFSSWPGYCRRSGVYCDTPWTSELNYPRASARTYRECRTACEQFPRCLSFHFVTRHSPRCRLFHYICPHAEFKSEATAYYYVKLSRVPIINLDMWRSAFSRSDLSNITRDPCEILGAYHQYSKVV